MILFGCNDNGLFSFTISRSQSQKLLESADEKLPVTRVAVEAEQPMYNQSYGKI